MRTEHEDTCTLHCTDNDKTAEATVMNFRQGDGLTVVLAESKIVMKYNKQHDIYIGSLMGLEFTTKGPKYYEVNEFRRTR
jgi:hypothetical protein